MIISEKYKYVFIQNQATASSNIGNELIRNYDGKYILEKHSSYGDFLKLKGATAKEYFVFCGIRNPLDQIVTFYYRRLIKGELPKNVSTFNDFLNYFYKRRIIFPGYFNTKDYKKVDYIIRYEHLQEDFTEVLKKLNIQEKNLLRKSSDPTPLKKGYINEYNDSKTQVTAVLYFKKAMIDLGYDFPNEWKVKINTSKIKLLFYWLFR